MVDVLGVFDLFDLYYQKKSNTPTQTHHTTETVKYLGYIYAKKMDKTTQKGWGDANTQ